MFISKNICKTGFASLLFLVINYNSYAHHNENEKNILVLHSYHQGLEWTDNITQGILQVFDSREGVNLFFDYLDIKRHYSKVYYQKLIELHKEKAKNAPFDVVIACDNVAFDFIKEYGSTYYPGIPIVYCGVNGLDTAEMKKYPNYYGVGETVDYYETILSIQNIFPERDKVLIIADNTLSGNLIQKELKPVLKQFKGKMQFEILSSFTLAELTQKIKSLDSSYAIYLLALNRDRNDIFWSYEKGINEIKSVSKVPIFGAWGYYIGQGVFGGKVTSGIEQGKQAALLASKLIDEKTSNAGIVPHFVNPKGKFTFDYKEMQRFGIRRNKLPPNSEIINKRKYQERFIEITIIIQVLLLLVLFFNIYRIKYKNRKALQLEKLIRQRTAELYSANKELEDIIQKKDKFFSILAHDLRNQIGSILNAAILLNKPSFLKKQDMVSVMHMNLLKTSNQTSHLLEDLLYWGLRQFKKKLQLIKTEVNINTTLESITEVYEINPTNISFKFNLTQNAEAKTDPQVIKFILRNIIHNAMKFSYDGGVVTLTTKDEGDRIVISVTDNGIGMNNEVVRSIYNGDPIRKESTTIKTTTGMGLTTALEYLKMLDGKLEIDSELGKGSTFAVILNRVCP